MIPVFMHVIKKYYWSNTPCRRSTNIPSGGLYAIYQTAKLMSGYIRVAVRQALIPWKQTPVNWILLIELRVMLIDRHG